MKIPAIVINSFKWLTSNAAVKFIVTVIASGGLATFWVETNTRTEMRVQIEKEIATGQIKVYNYLKSIEKMNNIVPAKTDGSRTVFIEVDQYGNVLSETKSQEVKKKVSQNNTPSFSVNFRDNQRILSLLSKVENELDNLDHEAYVKVQHLLDFIDDHPISDKTKESEISGDWTKITVYTEFFDIVHSINCFFEERYGKFDK